MDQAFRPLDSQDSIGDEELKRFGLPLELSVEIEQVEEDVEGITQTLLRLFPLALLVFPFLEGLDSFRRLIEQLGDLLALDIRALPSGVQLRFNAELLPA